MMWKDTMNIVTYKGRQMIIVVEINEQKRIFPVWLSHGGVCADNRWTVETNGPTMIFPLYTNETSSQQHLQLQSQNKHRKD